LSTICIAYWTAIKTANIMAKQTAYFATIAKTYNTHRSAIHSAIITTVDEAIIATSWRAFFPTFVSTVYCPELSAFKSPNCVSLNETTISPVKTS
jgi:hypothetical protein